MIFSPISAVVGTHVTVLDLTRWPTSGLSVVFDVCKMPVLPVSVKLIFVIVLNGNGNSVNGIMIV